MSMVHFIITLEVNLKTHMIGKLLPDNYLLNLSLYYCPKIYIKY